MTKHAELPELGQLDSGALVALSGLAPWAKDNTIFDQSRQRGQRRIRGAIFDQSRGTVRRVLYMAAQSAARHHPELRAFYQGLCERGKAKKVALVAVMRKLVTQLNAVARRGTPWDPQRAPTA